MAIVEMRKLNLAALSYDKDNILNALQRTGAAEIKTFSLESEDLLSAPADCEKIRAALTSAESALDILSAQVGAYARSHKIDLDVLKDGFEVPYTEFMSAGGKREQSEELIAKINALTDEKNRLNTELGKLAKTIQTAEIYSAVTLPLETYSDTAHAIVRLGTVPVAVREKFIAELENIALSDFEELASDGDNLLVAVFAHRSVKGELESALSVCSFTPCPFKGERSGREIFDAEIAEREKLTDELSRNADEMFALRDRIRPLKVYCDYVGFELEKAELSEKFMTTERTFLLEAYVPSGSEDKIAAELDSVTGAVYFEFSETSQDEMPPTLMKNGVISSNFEAITNMYSPPNAREFDPTKIMALFYSLFLGFIMGDVGYGLFMLVGGGAIYIKQVRDSGLKRLSGVFAIGGVFAIIWGLLFNSFFGISLSFIPTVMPDAQSDMWSLAGISVPAVFLISMIIGTVQLFAGYICRTIQCWRRGQILDGICDGVTWAFFSIGVALAIVGFIDEAGLSELAMVGGVIAGVSLLAAMLTAGRKEKLLGKFTKGFGAAYGVINYASDILSYARLYGLMLSGAVIAQIVSQYAIGFMTGGNIALIILGVILMIVGHLFNLAIGLLGAYIHDARLQYVEFYGRFFEGEGELFAPLGSKHKYIYISA